MAHSAEQLMLAPHALDHPGQGDDMADRETAGRGPRGVAKMAGGRNGRRLTTAVLVSALVLLGVWLRLGIVGGEWWQIQWLEVSGPFQRVSPEMVRGVMAPALGRGYFALDMDSLRREITQLPWVASIELRRRWPDTLEVVVVEHQPVAYWRDSAVVSQLGEIFPLQGQVLIQGLPRLFGPQGQKDQVLELWQQVQGRLDQVGLIADEFHMSGRGALWLRLANGMRVDLGREQLARRINRFVAAVPQLRGEWGELPLRVDMRYSNGFAVQWPAPPAAQREQEPEHG